MKQSRRVEPRVPYPEDVSLIRASGGKRIVARGVNISASGVYVHCVEPCEIGSDIICSVLLDGGPRKLRGRVTRLEALPGMIGVAIAFSELGGRDVAALREYVDRHQIEAAPAKIHLLGMPNPVRCQATREGDTIHLSTSLPFLRLDSEVGVHLDADPATETAACVLSRISLDPSTSDGVPRLALDVDVIPGRRMTGEPLEPPTRAVVAASQASNDPRPGRPDRRSPAGPVPSVVLSSTLQLETLASLRTPPLVEENRVHRDTAEVPRRWRFKDWSHPPQVSGSIARRRRTRLRASPRWVLRTLAHWTTLPFWASCILALVCGFVTALILR